MNNLSCSRHTGHRFMSMQTDKIRATAAELLRFCLSTSLRSGLGMLEDMISDAHDRPQIGALSITHKGGNL